MTVLLEQAFDAVRRLPPAQEGMVRAILTVARGLSGDGIAPDHVPYVLEGLAQIERGEFADEEEVENAFRAFEQ